MGKEKFDWRDSAGNKDIAPKQAEAKESEDSFDLNVMKAIFDGPKRPRDNVQPLDDPRK